MDPRRWGRTCDVVYGVREMTKHELICQFPEPWIGGFYRFCGSNEIDPPAHGLRIGRFCHTSFESYWVRPTRLWRLVRIKKGAVLSQIRLIVNVVSTFNLVMEHSLIAALDQKR